MTRTPGSVALAMLILVAGHLAPARALPPHASSRVRTGDVKAAAVVALALEASPTAARLIDTLQASDLIVTIVCGLLPRDLLGTTRAVVAVGSTRHVRITLSAGNGVRRLAAVLGHELQHAVEIASLPEIRDGDSQAAAYGRIGHAVSRGGYFETDAAVAAGRRVDRELDEAAAGPVRRPGAA